jgi:hypothetical protein
MMISRRKTTPSFGPDGRRVGGTMTTTCSASRRTVTNNRLFMPGQKLTVQRAPVMNGLSCAMKHFQRPMLKRRAYKGGADDALKKSSLGTKRRMDGMAKLMARAGRGLNFQLPTNSSTSKDDTASSSGESSDEEKEDRPFEPLMLWKSPHEGGEVKGLPSRM